MIVLNLGCGNFKLPRIYDKEQKWDQVVHLDINKLVEPDIVWDLNKHPLPFDDSSFNQIHAYDVLEHLGAQGDYEFFFKEWSEYYRILMPSGEFWGMVPWGNDYWVWGDPGHRRVITPGSLSFLSHAFYVLNKNLGSQVTDYRDICGCNFEKIYEKLDYHCNKYIFKLKAKPI